jgi:hypothetical protein
MLPEMGYRTRHVRERLDEYGAIVEYMIEGERPNKWGENFLKCHCVYRETHMKPTGVEPEAPLRDACA